MAVQDIITERIVTMLESGTVPWRKGWDSSSGFQIPVNYSTKRAYQGINIFLLAMSTYTSNQWLTYNQAKKLGATVKESEAKNSSVICYYAMLEDKKTGKKFPMLKYTRVYNICQIDGLPLEAYGTKEAKPLSEPEVFAMADKVFADMINPPSLQVEHGEPAYIPSKDAIRMPAKESFHGAGEYASTLFHELAHSTGHMTRLARFDGMTNHAFGSEDYSKEELIAEFTSALLCAHVGVSAGVIENQAAYLQSWIKVLKGDSGLVMKASSAANKALERIIGKQSSEACDEE